MSRRINALQRRLHNAARSLPGILRSPWRDRRTSGRGNTLNHAAEAPARLPQDLASTVRYFANPGPAFESRGTPHKPAAEMPVQAIAYYLPQFHAFDENDQWWGDGFTEWRNVARGTPRFHGHYQPRIPRDLGFYDLNDVSIMQRQSELARAAGITAFCFYYYWFNGKRLMQSPLDSFCDADIEQDFCILWANENWTRRWDGREQDVLIQQEYKDSDEDAFIADTARYLGHQRYLRIDGRPLFILYRPSLLPDARKSIERWRNKWTSMLGVEPLIYMVQSYDDRDPRPFLMDGAVEFPPHKVSKGIRNRNSEQAFFDSEFSGQVRDYQDLVENSLSEPAPEYPLIKTVAPHWDNDARREGSGVSFHGSTPGRFQHWLEGACKFARQNPVQGKQSLVFINAWNEWAEAAYLEPDVHYGHAYLNACYRALTGRLDTTRRNRLLLIGHDAHRNGAQMLLLYLARHYRSIPELEITIVLKQGGALLNDYRKIADTYLLNEQPPQWLDEHLQNQQYGMAICNTTVTGDLLPALTGAGVRTISLIHEMPELIERHGLENKAQTIATHAHHLVFPAEIVARGFETIAGTIHGRPSIRPQGLYRQIIRNESEATRLRESLKMNTDDSLVVNLGYADSRKGFDRFVELATEARTHAPHLHFLWVGARDSEMWSWIKQAKAIPHLHLREFRNDLDAIYGAADVLFLSSREDPYPSVVLEALDAGLPIVAYVNATGLESVIEQHGELIDTDVKGRTLAELIVQVIATDDETLRQSRRDWVAAEHDFAAYARHLIELLRDSRV